MLFNSTNNDIRRLRIMYRGRDIEQIYNLSMSSHPTNTHKLITRRFARGPITGDSLEENFSNLSDDWHQTSSCSFCLTVQSFEGTLMVDGRPALIFCVLPHKVSLNDILIHRNVVSSAKVMRYSESFQPHRTHTFNWPHKVCFVYK